MNFLLVNFHKDYEVACPVGVWTTIISASGRSYTEIYLCSIFAHGAVIAGSCKVRSGYIFTHTDKLPLQAEMTFKKTAFDTSYRVQIYPEQEVTVHIPARGGTAKFMSYLVSFWLYVVIIFFVFLLLYSVVSL